MKDLQRSALGAEAGSYSSAAPCEGFRQPFGIRDHHPLLLLLLGPKGAGKSTLGRLLEQVAGVHFLEVERIWLDYMRQQEARGMPYDQAEGRKLVSAELAKTLRRHLVVSAETTGADQDILKDFLRAKAVVKVIRLSVSLDLSLERISQRDAKYHIPINTSRIVQVHELSSSLSLKADLELDMNKLDSVQAVCAVMRAFSLGGTC